MAKKRLNVDVDEQMLKRYQKICKAENSTSAQMTRILIEKFVASFAGKHELI